jgi:hypothetical protein
MRERLGSTLVLLFSFTAQTQTMPGRILGIEAPGVHAQPSQSMFVFRIEPGACGREHVVAGWRIIKEGKGAFQIAVPPEWVPLGEISAAAVFHDPTTAIVVVTSQPGQQFKPLSPVLLRTIRVPKEKMFENSATRIFYQDKTARNPNDTSAFSASVPAQNGTCSCHVVILPSIKEDVAKKIASASPLCWKGRHRNRAF